MKRKTHEEFIEEVREKQGERFIILSEYIDAKTKIYSRCSHCGTTEYKNPWDILKGSCKNCHRVKLSQVHSKTHKEFKKEVEYGGGYLLLSEYRNSKEKVEIKHLICGHNFFMTPSKFSYGQRCPDCMRPNHNRTHEEFLKQFMFVANGEYEVLGEFTTVEKKTLIKHKKCGCEYEVSPHKFINGKRRCPKCANNIKLTQREFEKRVNQIDPDYKVLGKYESVNKKVLLKHKKCGNAWKTKPSNFYNGKRCPKCNASKGELAIEKYLIENDYSYETQYKINQCKLKNPLPFDFAVFSNNSIVLIEFQGEQHYKERDFFGGETAFKKQKLRDNIKLKYCQDNRIPFIAIPYYEIENIPNILKGFL
ncbi:hypothetical protein [Enterococcus sp. C50]|uniref:hypothetical protein n=1 Tax=Enterococcus sp. C50 TaxID=3231311 RepID=UPI00349FEB7A